MLCRKFELIPFKIGFFTNFKVAPKLGQRPCTIVHGLWSNFIKNGKERILHFYNFFLIHIHVLMLHIKFELIPINIGFFTNF